MPVPLAGHYQNYVNCFLLQNKWQAANSQDILNFTGKKPGFWEKAPNSHKPWHIGM